MSVKIKKPIPFAFVLDLLGELEPITRPMFGCTAVYVDDKIVLILREKPTETHDNGVWIATTVEHHESLRKEFPIMRSIRLLAAGGVTGWQNLPSISPDFEESVTRVCRLIAKRDLRVGKVPKPKRNRSKNTRKKTTKKKR